jgi:hypothetical protein
MKSLSDKKITISYSLKLKIPIRLRVSTQSEPPGLPRIDVPLFDKNVQVGSIDTI